MGTSLTGLTPSTTYDALIKVGDNGALSATAKVLSDGLGNDSVLALSTSRVGIGTASPIAILDVRATSYLTSTGTDGTLADAIILGNSSFPNTQSNRIRTTTSASAVGNKISIEAGNGTTGSYVDNQLVLNGDGNVGIGTPTPEINLDIKGSATASSMGMFIENAAGSTLNNSADIYFGTWGGSTIAGITNARISAVNVNAGNAESNLDFYTYNGSSSAKRISVTSNGLTFNGDTAAANALDDYEEGTWTMGVSFGGASVGVTYSANTGTYTKIGRQVTINGYIALTSKGSSTGSAAITGIPFNIGGTSGFYSAPTFGQLFNVSHTGFVNGFGNLSSTIIGIQSTSSLGTLTTLTDTNFSNNTEFMLSFTYFV
jgi:hypothetical protein